MSILTRVLLTEQFQCLFCIDCLKRETCFSLQKMAIFRNDKLCAHPFSRGNNCSIFFRKTQRYVLFDYFLWRIGPKDGKVFPSCEEAKELFTQLVTMFKVGPNLTHNHRWNDDRQVAGAIKQLDAALFRSGQAEDKLIGVEY